VALGGNISLRNARLSTLTAALTDALALPDLQLLHASAVGAGEG